VWTLGEFRLICLPNAKTCLEGVNRVFVFPFEATTLPVSLGECGGHEFAHSVPILKILPCFGMEITGLG